MHVRKRNRGMLGASLCLAALTVAPAVAQQTNQKTAPRAETQPMVCPMCGQMMPGGRMPGGTMMGPMMHGMMGMQPGGSATIQVAPDGTVYILRGNTLYKYSNDLRLLGSAELPASNPRAAEPGSPATTNPQGR
jgi:hypothetical protein